jgi:hypothetical protein
MVIASEWPDLGVEFAAQTIGVDVLLAAARRARQLWPSDDPPGDPE